MKIDIEGLNKVQLLKALYDYALPTEKTDINREVSMLDFMRCIDKDRKVNLLNGKVIKTDLGRDKLSSGVYDRYNGQYTALNAVYWLKQEYNPIPYTFINEGESLMNVITFMAQQNNAVFNFNGHLIYSDNVCTDDILMRWYGKVDYALLDKHKYNVQESILNKKFNKKLNQLYDMYAALAVGIIPDNHLFEWYKFLSTSPINNVLDARVIDIFLAVTKELKSKSNEDHFAKAKMIVNTKGEAGMNIGLFYGLLQEFPCPKSYEFMRYMLS